MHRTKNNLFTVKSHASIADQFCFIGNDRVVYDIPGILYDFLALRAKIGQVCQKHNSHILNDIGVLSFWIKHEYDF